MELFDVYPLYDVTPVAAKGLTVVDDKGREYWDFYGGHAVISIGHCHPTYVARLKDQLDRIAFYSNSVHNPLAVEVAHRLGRISQCDEYRLFMCNSGAEANENALKLASFHTGRSKVLAFRNGFHGRTSAAVAATDNPKINAPLNEQHQVTFVALGDIDAVRSELEKGDVCAVIIESVQGVGGLDEPTTTFFKGLASLCEQYGTVLIADEVQAGFGRTGKFFGFQHHGIKPDIISMAKGMGNGFPVGGILIHPKFKASYGLLGTTFGGNHLACAATLAVMEVIESENLITNAGEMGDYFVECASKIPEITRVKGRGLMLGLEFDFEVSELRKRLIFDRQIFTGGSSNKNLLRFLPALNITRAQTHLFFEALKACLK